MADRTRWRDDVLKGLSDILDILDACPWQADCTCGWKGAKWPDEADAQAEAWAHGRGCL